MRWYVPNRWRVMAAIIVVAALFFGGVGARIVYRRNRHLKTVRSELARDFPGFDVTQLDHYISSLSPPDASPSDHFVLALRTNPGFTLQGHLLFSDDGDSPDDAASIRATVFDGRRLSPAVLDAFALEWLRTRGHEAVVVGDESDTGTTAAQSLELDAAGTRSMVDSATIRLIARRLPLHDTFGFEPAGISGMYWFLLDRRTGRWAALGTTATLLGRYGRP